DPVSLGESTSVWVLELKYVVAEVPIALILPRCCDQRLNVSYCGAPPRSASLNQTRSGRLSSGVTASRIDFTPLRLPPKLACTAARLKLLIGIVVPLAWLM